MDDIPTNLWNTLVTTFLILYGSILCLVKQLIPYKYRAKSIKDEVVLITGSGSGLGKSLAKKIAKMRTRLVLVDINEEANLKTAEEIRAEGGNATTFTCDLSQKNDIYRVAEEVILFELFS